MDNETKTDNSLDQEEDQLVNCLLHGGFNLKDLPWIPPKVVKLYVASGSSEYEEERDILQREVYPDLKRYCRETHGIDFHAVDLRSGSSGHAGDIADACIQEIHSAQRKSMGPNFLCLIGTDEKRCFPPEEIEKDEYETLLEYLASNDFEDEALLVDSHYKEDKNSIPTTYRLQQKFRGYEENSDHQIPLSKLLLQILVNAADSCLEKELITSKQYLKYKISDLEREVEEGILGVDSEARLERCIVCKKRSAKEMQENQSFNETEKDIKYRTPFSFLGGAIDSASKSANLICEMTYSGKLNDKQKISSITHELYCRIKTLIDDSVENNKNAINGNHLHREVYNQWNFVKSSAKPFLGREELMYSVKSYFLSETDKPFSIVGGNGVGKTASMLQIAQDVNTAITNKALTMRTALIIRFIGKTQRTDTAQQLLLSLCRHIVDIMGKRQDEIPEDYKQLKTYFIELLQNGEFGGMLIILLDSLDQLQDDFDLEWLPSRIAVNIKLIVSSSNGNKKAIKNLTRKCKENMFHLQSFVPLECEKVFKASMNANRRTISFDQMKIVKNAFQYCSLPLFVTVVIENAKLWESHDPLHLCTTGNDLEESILVFLENLELCHGVDLVSHILAYITTTRHGISESELVDVLSIDEHLLNIVFSDFHPSIRRIPPVLVVRVLHAIEAFLEEKEIDGVLGYIWKYDAFKEIARTRYLNDDFNKYIHSNLSDYYLGTWGGSFKKPFEFSKEVIQQRKLPTAKSQSCRFIPEQQNHFGVTEASERYNVRKFAQLPFSLFQCGRLKELNSELLCNFNFLLYKIKSSSVIQLLEDFHLFSDPESHLVGEALKMSAPEIQENLNCLGIELTGRLLPHRMSYENIRRLIYQCDLHSQKFCPLVAKCQCYNTPGGPILYTFNAEEGNVDLSYGLNFHQCPNGIFLSTKSLGGPTLRVWEISHGDPRPQIMMPLGKLRESWSGHYLVEFCNDGSLKIFDTDSGELHGEIQFQNNNVACISSSNKYVAFSFKGETVLYVVDMENACIEHKFSSHPSVIGFNSEDTHLVFNSGCNLFLHQLPLMQRKCVAKCSDVPTDILLFNDAMKCIVVTKTRHVESIIFDVINKMYKNSNLFTDIEFRECKLSNTGSLVVFRSAKCLRLMDARTDKIIYTFSDLPPSRLCNPHFTYTGVGFTPCDEMLLASRMSFIAVWNCSNGNLLRILQTSSWPIKTLFTSASVHKAVTVSEDNTVQVLDLCNITKTTQYSNAVFDSKVKSAVALKNRSEVICCGEDQISAKVVHSGNGEILSILKHSIDSSVCLDSVLASPNGRYVITLAKKINQSYLNSSVQIHADGVLWDVESGIKKFHASDVRHAVFSHNSSIVVFVLCTNMSSDWTENVYDLEMLNFMTGSNLLLDFPYNTEFVSSPHIITDNDFASFVSIVQTYETLVNEETDEETVQVSTQLFIRNLLDTSENYRMIGVNEIDPNSGFCCRFVDIFPYHGNQTLIVYELNEESFAFDLSKGIVRPCGNSKSAVIYNLEREECIRHFPSFLQPSVDLNTIRISSNHNTILDEEFNVYHFHNDFSIAHKLKESFATNLFHFTIDGLYVVGLSVERTHILVVRTTDSLINARVPIHGYGSCISVGADDRTVVVGCSDGRVMIFALVLQLSDPVVDLIAKIPSRSHTEEPIGEPLKSDLHRIDFRFANDNKLSKRVSKSRRPPSHHILSNAVMVTQQANQDRSRPCYLQ